MVCALLLKITAKKASMNRKFPFTVHRRVGTFILLKRKGFVCVADRKDFNPVGHCLLCAFLQLNVLLKHFIRKVQGNI